VEINKYNLIYYGVPEAESDSDSELSTKIFPLPPSPESTPVTIATNRIGKKKRSTESPNRPRPVKINFPNLVTRQAAWKLSQGLPTLSE